MKEQLVTQGRDAVHVEDAASIRVMGFPVLEALPSGSVPYERVDPFILVHEGRMRLSEMADVDTKHPHRGFDNLWYILEGSASTGHSTGPGGAIERARLPKGALLALRTGRGVWHAEAIGAEERAEGHHAGPGRVPGLRVRAGWRSRVRHERAPSHARPIRPPGRGGGVHGDRCRSGHPLPPDGREALRRDAGIQRSLRGLTAGGRAPERGPSLLPNSPDS